MSKRSTTEAEAAPPRRRFGLPRLADVRIRSKLGLILIVPVVALVGIAGVRLYDSSQQALTAEDSATLAEFTTNASSLLYSLQAERVELVIQNNKDDLELGKDRLAMSHFEDAADNTDEKLKEFKTARVDLPLESEAFGAVLDDIEEVLDEQLGNVRNRVLEERAGAGDVGVYNAGIAWLSNVFEHVLDVTTDPELSRDLRASGLITAADEYSEKMRLMVLDLDSGKNLGTQRFRTFIEQEAGREQALLEFNRIVATDSNITRVDTENGLASHDSRAATNLEDLVLNGDSQTSLKLDHAELMKAYDSRHQASNGFVDDAQDQSVADANRVRDEVVRQVLIEIAVVLVTLVIAVMLALVIARSMALSLRRLREGALEVAHVDLPRAVAAMREADGSHQRSPEQIIAELGDPLRLDNRDEVGTVAGAFNTVHREAVRIAAEQAALRSSVSQMFVNLARRSQNLVDRLIGHLDRLERGEEDPDRLAELFQLDHLATRMRRNDENLLVLAGADSTRVERNSAQIGDVLRAAQSEVEQYTRVEFGTVLADSEVEAGAINDIVHLIAELLDNATAFSPPDTAVIAEARQVGDEIFVRITDRGIGISPEQLIVLNAQLNAPASVDISASRMMGLVVVARLAQRHHLKVTLQEGAGRGTIAEVVLPAELLTGSRGRESQRSIDPAPQSAIGGEFPAYPEAQPLAPMPRNESISAPSNLFEPLDMPEPGRDPFAQPAAEAVGPDSRDRDKPSPIPGGRGVSFYPGDGVDGGGMPRRKIMEVTGEIVAESAADGAAAVLPMIRLDAAPLPGKAPEIPTPRAQSDDAAPPAWPAAANGSRTADPVAAVGRFGAMDETMELPIFREVESAWFKTSTPSPRPASADSESVDPIGQEPILEAGSSASKDEDRYDFSTQHRGENSTSAQEVVGEVSQSDSTSGTDSRTETGFGTLPQRQIDTPPEAPEVPEFNPVANRSQTGDSMWHTAADRGWQVAAETGARSPEESTGAGLPKRRPMDRLVPGSVEPNEPAAPNREVRRDPEGVRGLLSAYHRGVQRGRGNDS